MKKPINTLLTLIIICVIFKDEDRLQNVALGASGYPSSTPAYGYSFSYAVDGITDNTELVAGTGLQEFPYLVVDLGKPFAVDRVEIYGSGKLILKLIKFAFFYSMYKVHDTC